VRVQNDLAMSAPGHEVAFCSSAGFRPEVEAFGLDYFEGRPRLAYLRPVYLDAVRGVDSAEISYFPGHRFFAAAPYARHRAAFGLPPDPDLEDPACAVRTLKRP
jgi:hypothetical protein